MHLREYGLNVSHVVRGGDKDTAYDDLGTEALDDQVLEGTEGGPVDDGTMDP